MMSRTPLLSLRPVALSCYKRYGTCIEHLELTSITVENLSTFHGYVSAFINIRSLTCSHIRLPMKVKHSTNLRRLEGKPLKIESLWVSVFIV